MSLDLPAWSAPFAAEHRERLRRRGPWGKIDRGWAFGDGSGRGLRVAIVDSGVEADHPAVGGRLVESVAVERAGDDWVVVATEPADVVGHGTACAGIIHALAPEADIVSIRVLGPDNRGNGGAFATGLLWAIEESGASIANLSLSSRSDAFFGPLHELADEAYFRNVLLVSAANNVSVASYPSLYASVVSVAAHDMASARFVVLQPGAPGRVRGIRAQRGRRVAGRDADGGDREQLRGAAHRGLRRADPGRAPGRHAVRDEVDPRRDGRQRGVADAKTAGPLGPAVWRSGAGGWSALAVRVVARGALRELALRGRAAGVEMPLDVVVGAVGVRMWPPGPSRALVRVRPSAPGSRAPRPRAPRRRWYR